MTAFNLRVIAYIEEFAMSLLCVGARRSLNIRGDAGMKDAADSHWVGFLQIDKEVTVEGAGNYRAIRESERETGLPTQPE